MQKTIIILACIFMALSMFGLGYIAGHIKGYEDGRKSTLIEVYRLYNVKDIPMNDAIEIAGAGDEGIRKVWEGGNNGK